MRGFNLDLSPAEGTLPNWLKAMQPSQEKEGAEGRGLPAR